MCDDLFQKRLTRLASRHQAYLKELEKCEVEYVRRFGTHPSDWNDELWIDFAHLGDCATPTVQEVTEGACLSKKVSGQGDDDG